MVHMINKHLQDTELRVSRTKTIHHYRDSNLQDTSRVNKDLAKYNPECKNVIANFYSQWKLHERVEQELSLQNKTFQQLESALLNLSNLALD